MLDELLVRLKGMPPAALAQVDKDVLQEDRKLVHNLPICGGLMGRPLLDIVGQRFHRLTVTKWLGRENHSSVWLCACDCGAEIRAQGGSLKSGDTKSCGCYRQDRMKTLTYKHGECGGEKRSKRSSLYKTWDGIRQRCGNPTAKGYANYGGRGIKVCGRWMESFENFAADMGPKPTKSHSLDRYPDNNGDYSPENCRWATPKEQARNTRNNKIVVLNGVSMTMVEAAEKAGIPYYIVKNRMSCKGWSFDRTISTPVRRHAARDT